mmetsp:Transcript_17966/g.41080  ORF Transcript_17966/g.41080 Transcript_17966/m.41080 type:complete len:438 (-) Transcript_17966:474-1787(-)|eukprot:CAMPEP_0201128178 /NCGR_PEP_ID=MMETSP0850-20130426/32887_1 /ASSEMBLY_ACC=CAM_ASM_000622 /TAXON_ID=183588 /ORGANISM="Pseudo-nitzschia fraudulenta, Strain WWA7" /LENGTH=437 /DNA_ID=CAMNT_0047397269 /DNA_START=92 /DNA_END=1405 /DNA_ORIENTATION=+
MATNDETIIGDAAADDPFDTSCPLSHVAGGGDVVVVVDDETYGIKRNRSMEVSKDDEGKQQNQNQNQNQNRIQQQIHVYNPRKPKWWNRLGNNGRDATKSQKRAMRKVLDGVQKSTDTTTTAAATTDGQQHQNQDQTPAKGLRLPPVPYGSKLDWKDVFPDSSEESRYIWLELGFGRGENLQALLESKLLREKEENDGNGDHKKFYLVGAEVSGVGIGCLCKRIEQQLQQQKQPEGTDRDPGYVLYRPEMDPFSSSDAGDDATTAETRAGGFLPSATSGVPYQDRLRIHAGDGYKLLPKLPDGSLSAILITFPDPFPKDTDVNYRLVQQQTLLECHRILRKKNNNNSLLFLATDHDGYHGWCHKIMQEVNSNTGDNNNSSNEDSTATAQPETSSPSPLFRLLESCPDRMDWLPAISRYEQKGWDEGRSTKLSCWVVV